MSNKKQSQPYIGKAAAVVEAGSAPPRYQSPPQPGILKQQPPPSHAHSSGGLLKDAKLHPYSSKPLAPDGLKPNSNPNNYTFAPNAPQQGLKPPYSRYPLSANPNQTGIPKQQSKSKVGPEDDRRVLSRPGGSFENPNFVITRIHKPEEDFTTKAIVHQRSQEELSKSPTPQTQNIIRPHSGVPFHRPARFSDEELLKFSPVDMLKFVRKSEGDNARLAAEQHHHMQMLVNELRSLKETNQRLADDNQELRDLCCFLDDDRQKGRKLAREWQRFGRYTASVMRQEVSAYQNKLRELENKQQELIKDNLELKELCLYLDEERGLNSVCPSCGNTSNVVMRDDGDGSSSSTNADEPSVPIQFNSGNIVTNTPRRSASRERLLNESLSRQRNTFNDQTMQYVRSLEQRVKQLEDEKKILLHKMSQFGDISDLQIQDTSVLTGRPEAVVRALQVLEVREQLERDSRALEHLQPPPSTADDNELSREEITSSADPVVGADMDDGEKALVREMCNVVWRKLEEASPQRR